MIKLHEGGVFISDGITPVDADPSLDSEQARRHTIAYSILGAHNTSGNDEHLKLRFDALASHDITYVNIIQTAKLGELKEFPLPYVLTNCHNSLCAVGGTINEDDHMFGLSAAKHYGGIYVPAHQSVIHSYMRETMAGCGKMILGSDSHTRYGALGTMAIGEGGPEIIKQLFGRTYDVEAPKVVAVYMTGSPKAGVGPQDVALAIIGAVYRNNFVKNKVMEFIGSGIAGLSAEFRNGIDVMTTETACLTSIWMTDSATESYLKQHGRESEYRQLKPDGIAYYDSMIEVNLSEIEPMIALPYHPSNVYTVRELKENAADILTPLGLGDKITDNGIAVGQGVIAGCAGGIYDNLCAAASMLRGNSIGNGNFALSVYPASQPVFEAIIHNGVAADLMRAGATMRTAFCGPCFGAGDVPANNSLSIRHTTRNFPNREGSIPSAGQKAAVALMDARSIAATARNGGILTSALEFDDVSYDVPDYEYDDTVYRNRVYNGYGRPDPTVPLVYGPNITDWPKMGALADNLLLEMASVITDPVTTTDELIPSGESSSYRSNPLKLAELTLARKDPNYLGRAKGANVEFEKQPKAVKETVMKLRREGSIGTGSVIFAVKPGDGSARAQAASCQRVLGGMANIAVEYATKRYRSNLINWGMLPLIVNGRPEFEVGDRIFLPDIRYAVRFNSEWFDAYIIKPTGDARPIKVRLGQLTEEERKIILDRCLINYYNTPAKA